MKMFYERGQLDKKFIDFYCKDNWNTCIRYEKEEKGIYHPDNMRPDGIIDEHLF